MKRTFCIFLVILCLVLCACGSNMQPPQLTPTPQSEFAPFSAAQMPGDVFRKSENGDGEGSESLYPVSPDPVPTPTNNNQSSETETFEIAAAIGAGYLVWANLFDIPDVATEPSYSEMPNNPSESIMYLDDLAIVYDKVTLQTIWVGLFYLDNTVQDSETPYQALRLIALYTALERGKPQEKDYSDTSKAMSSAEEFYKGFLSALTERESDLLNGKAIPFSRSRYGNYYVSLSDEGIFVYVR